MRTIGEVSTITGLSVRTLRHYDAIGLLKPAKVTEAGYRLYDDGSLGRLQSILLFRELQFSLKEIREMLDSPDFDPAEALEQQIGLLELQYRRMGELLAFAREIQGKGVKPMAFQVFDKSEMERYKAEARARWGETGAYREYEARQQAGEDCDGAAAGLMERIAAVGVLRRLPPDHPEVRERVEALRDYISGHFYTCTPEVFGGLGQMYADDERFRSSIDGAAGEGAAAFISRAIAAYCAGL